uniref:DUF4283 domain-containing protein n=1 Tax=Opuntia streptacantha TaxID=393608 RepID=A0A7C9CSY6_OPUST
MDRPYCCTVELGLTDLLSCLGVCGIYSPSWGYWVVNFLCLPSLVIAPSDMSSSPPVNSHGLDSENTLPPSSVLSRTESLRVSSPPPAPKASFSEALALGLGGSGKSSAGPSVQSEHQSAPAHNSPVSMSSLCLLGKPWGDPIPLAIIMSKTRKDWGFIKGQIDYIELGNGWLLFRFSNLQDISLVWDGRPWHVSGLNLVLRRWEPFFDPYSATIQRIDQWVKITRLPLELWEEETLRLLLQDVGHFIKVDDITLNRSKGKFARVCLNIDITKPLRGSLFLPIPNQPRPLEVPISYEGLHEVCAWCGSNAHNLDTCPETPKGPLEIIVEKFGATKLQNDSDSCPLPNASSQPVTEKWVTVAPKNRDRSLTQPRRKSSSKVGPNPAPPIVKIVSKSPDPAPDNAGCITAEDPVVSPGPPPAAGVLIHQTESAPSPEADVGQHGSEIGNSAPSGPSHSTVSAPGAMVRDSPSIPHLSLSSPISPITGSALEDEDVDMFLNLEPEEEIQLSPESTKKRKLEVGDASSPSHSPI